MKGLKFLAACAAVGAVSVACAAASFAVDTTYQLTVSQYNATNGTIDITVPTEYAKLVKGDYTLLVLSDDATSITEANKGIIKQIQQGDNTILTGVKVGTGLEKSKTYYVRVGGANATEANPTGFAAGEFTVPSSPDNPYGDCKRLLGNVDDDTIVTGADAAQVMLLAANKTTLTGEKLQAADCDDDGVPSGADAAQIFLHAANKNTSVDFTKTVATKAKWVAEN